MSCKNCGCYERLVGMAQRLADETVIYSPEEIHGIEDVVFITLSCVEQNHRDYAVRTWAREQLTAQWCLEQKAKSLLLRITHSLTRN